MHGQARSNKSTVSFDCTFTTFSDEKAAQQKQKKPFVLHYVLDTKTKKAYLLGELGSSEASPVAGALGITFIEILPTGAAQTTTINNSSKRATHSRHTLVGTEIWPSQFYGSCDIK